MSPRRVTANRKQNAPGASTEPSPLDRSQPRRSHGLHHRKKAKLEIAPTQSSEVGVPAARDHKGATGKPRARTLTISARLCGRRTLDPLPAVGIAGLDARAQWLLFASALQSIRIVRKSRRRF